MLSVTYSECVFVALAIRRAMDTRRVISLSLSHKGHDLKKRIIVSKTLSEIFPNEIRPERNIKSVNTPSCKVTIFLV